MRLLWVTAIAPDFSGGGGHLRQAHLLRAAAARFDVDLLLAGRLRDPEVKQLVASLREVDVGVPPEPSNRTARRLRDLRYAAVERRPFEVAQHRRVRAALAPVMETLDAPETFAVVNVEFVGLAPLLKQQRRQPWVITLHNLASVMARQRLAFTSGRRRLALGRLEVRNAERFEAWVVDSYDTTIVCSEEDASQLPAGRKAVIPNGTDVGAVAPRPLPADPRVLFSGALYTAPNLDGLEWFLSDVWPRVTGSLPSAELDVVGLDPPASLLERCEAVGVRVHADVPSVLPHLERSRVAVVPLRVGSGSRLKALEAMAAGRPVVGTSIGLGGLDVEHERDVLVADRAEDFAAAVVRLCTDDALAASLAASARALAERRYDWAEIGTRYADELERLATAGRP